MSTRGVNRNDPCPCGSGKKYKKCCLTKPPKGKRSFRAEAPFTIRNLLKERLEQEGIIPEGPFTATDQDFRKEIVIKRKAPDPDAFVGRKAERPTKLPIEIPSSPFISTDISYK